MATAVAGQRRPGLGEAADLLRNAASMRLRHPTAWEESHRPVLWIWIRVLSGIWLVNPHRHPLPVRPLVGAGVARAGSAALLLRAPDRPLHREAPGGGPAASQPPRAGSPVG